MAISNSVSISDYAEMVLAWHLCFWIGATLAMVLFEEDLVYFSLVLACTEVLSSIRETMCSGWISCAYSVLVCTQVLSSIRETLCGGWNSFPRWILIFPVITWLGFDYHEKGGTILMFLKCDCCYGKIGHGFCWLLLLAGGVGLFFLELLKFVWVGLHLHSFFQS